MISEDADETSEISKPASSIFENDFSEMIVKIFSTVFLLVSSFCEVLDLEDLRRLQLIALIALTVSLEERFNAPNFARVAWRISGYRSPMFSLSSRLFSKMACRAASTTADI